MDSDDGYPCKMSPAYMNPIWMYNRNMLGVFYFIVEYILASYDVMWECVINIL